MELAQCEQLLGVVPQLNCEQLRGLRTFLRARSALSGAVILGSACAGSGSGGQEETGGRVDWAGAGAISGWPGRLTAAWPGRETGAVVEAGGRRGLMRRCTNAAAAVGWGAVPADGAMVCWHGRRNR